VRPAGAVGGEGGTTLPLDDYAVSEGASPCVGYCMRLEASPPRTRQEYRQWRGVSSGNPGVDGGLYIMFDISPMAPNEYHQKTARIPRSG
jgi:hypothetical protein